MRRVYVSCTERVIGERYVSDLVLLDVDSNRVLASRPVVLAIAEKVPGSGRSRGGRGICWHRGELTFAINSGILETLDPETLQARSRREIPDCSEVHLIRSHADVLHLCSTWTNRVIRINGDLVTSNFVLSDELRQFVGAERAKRPDWQDHLHFNSIAWNFEGEEFHLYSHPSIIFNWTKKEIMYQGDKLRNAHDLHFLDNRRLLVNSSWERKTKLFDTYTRTFKTVYEEPNAVILDLLIDHAKTGWLRGLMVDHSSGLMLISAAPGRLHILELGSWRVLQTMEFSTHPHCTPFDIALHPEDW